MHCPFTSAHVITMSPKNMRFHRLSLNQFGVLAIRGAQPEDAGNYTCLATNEAGTSSQSVSLTFAGESNSWLLNLLIGVFDFYSYLQ